MESAGDAMQLADKYKPRTWDDVLGQPKAVKIMRRMAENGIGGRAYFLSGKSGTGKNSIADVAAHSFAHDCQVFSSVGRELDDSTLNYWLELASGRGLAGNWAFIVDEIHGLSKRILERLLAVTDTGKIPEYVAWFFTTTWDGKAQLFETQADMGPFTGRCVEVPLTNQGLTKVFAEQAQKVARLEGLDGKPLPAYVALLTECNQSLRQAYNRIEAGAMLD